MALAPIIWNIKDDRFWRPLSREVSVSMERGNTQRWITNLGTFVFVDKALASGFVGVERQSRPSGLVALRRRFQRRRDLRQSPPFRQVSTWNFRRLWHCVEAETWRTKSIDSLSTHTGPFVLFRKRADFYRPRTKKNGRRESQNDAVDHLLFTLQIAVPKNGWLDMK